MGLGQLVFELAFHAASSVFYAIVNVSSVLIYDLCL